MKFESQAEIPRLKIMTCVGSIADYAGDMPYGLDMMIQEESKDKLAFPTHEYIDNISFRAKDSERVKEGLITGGDNQYVMSGVNSKDKFSSGFYGCVGLVVVGIDKDSGENISIGLHTPLYDPDVDYKDRGLNSLALNLRAQLNSLKEQCLEGSIDSVMLGGLIDETYGDSDKEIYTKTSDFIGYQVEQVIGARPTIAGGPKRLSIEKKTSKEFQNSSQGDTFYFDNARRRLYLVRPEYLKD
jgi:hypothetical protein